MAAHPYKNNIPHIQYVLPFEVRAPISLIAKRSFAVSQGAADELPERVEGNVAQCTVAGPRTASVAAYPRKNNTHHIQYILLFIVQ